MFITAVPAGASGGILVHEPASVTSTGSKVSVSAIVVVSSAVIISPFVQPAPIPAPDTLASLFSEMENVLTLFPVSTFEAGLESSSIFAETDTVFCLMLLFPAQIVADINPMPAIKMRK